MRKKINLSSLNLIYLCVMAVYMAIREVMPLNFLIDHVAVSGAIFLLGGVLLVCDLAGQRRCIRGAAADLLILFLIVCCVSSLVNIKYGVFGNVKLIAALAIEFLVFFAYGKGKSREEISRSVTAITVTLIITWAIFTLVSALMYFFSVDYMIFGIGSWGVVNQGFSSEYVRLWGIFQDPNYASVICLVSVLSSLRLILTKKSWAVRILCVLNILLQLTYMVLGGSRTGLLLMLFCSVALVLWKFLFSKGFSLKNIALGAGSAVVSVFVVLAMVSGFRTALPAVKNALFPEETPSVVGKLYWGLYEVSGLDFLPYGYDDAESPEEGGTGSIDRSDIEEMEDVSNGRIKRWKHAFQVFLKSPVIGTSPRNISAFAEENNPETLMGQYGIASHNGYIDVLVGTGIAGFLVLAAAVLMCTVEALRKFFKKDSSFEVAYLTVQLFALGASAVFISDIFMIFSMGAFMFWLTLGLIYNYDREPEESGIVYKLFNKIFRRKEKEA